MKRSDIDWSVLRKSLIIFCCCLLVSGAMLGGSFYFKDKMQAEHQRNNALFRSVSNQYFAIDEEERLITENFPVFIDLYNRGVIGRERRLDWIETLRKIGDELKIPSLSYEIRSQEAYKPEFSVNMGRFKLYRSVMNLNIQLLHEGDLFRLLEALDENALGQYNVSNCAINARGNVISDNPDSANLIARCELSWYTIKLANGKELKV